jgi:hypothetical protein
MNPALAGLSAYAVAATLLPATLVISRETLSRNALASIFLPLIWAADVYCWRCGLGALPVIHVFWATELLLFRDPRRDFKVLHRNAAGSEKKDDKHVGLYRREEFPSGVMNRLLWAMKIVVSLRFLGLDIGAGKLAVPREERQVSRSRWLLGKIMVAVLCMLTLDGTTSWTLYDPYFMNQASIDSPLPGFVPLYAFFSLSPRLFRLGVILAPMHVAMLEYCHVMPAIICVSLGGVNLVGDWWGNPRGWPDVIGDPFEIFRNGLRGFWGSFWQQLFRHVHIPILSYYSLTNSTQMFVDPGKALTRYLNIPAKSTTGYAIIIATAFFVSSIFHGFTFPRGTADLDPLRYAGFFWVQALCVVAEVGVSRMLKGKVPSGGHGKMALRALWTLAVFYSTIPLYGSELVKFMVSVDRPTLIFPMP